jgi:hypothetical protein
MAAIPNTQFGRKVSLLLVEGEQALDLSNMRFRFSTMQEDEESPNNCSIRVFNLNADTVRQVQKEYTRVVLQAGYENGSFGVIFDGTIKQFRIGREGDAVNSYIDILAADSDLAYNYAVVNKTLAAGSGPAERIAVIIAAKSKYGIKPGTLVIPSTGGVLPRGKVLFGMAKTMMRSEVQNIGATWSLQNGQVNVLPLDGYLPGEAVVLSALTGLIGRVEQTQDGIRARCLLNPKVVVGGLVKIDNKSVNQTLRQNPDSAPVAYNQWAGIQNLATVTSDGLYRVYVAEHTGDTKGQEFYTDLVCLTVNPVLEKVIAK